MSYGTISKMTEPLLRNKDSYEADPDECEVFVATSEKAVDPPRSANRRRRMIVLLCVGGAIALAIGTAAYLAMNPLSSRPRRNVILLVSDGFGPASLVYSRTFYQTINNLPYNYQTPLDTILVGSSRTRSSNSLVTDSAAGATAFSCALKTYNAAVGVNPLELPCGTVLEAAKLGLGMTTALVVTSRITHATPAAFSAHVLHRDMESTIAEQQLGDYPLGRMVDLAFGGGKCFFLPNNTEGSCRADDRDLWSEAPSYGWKNRISSKAEFDAIDERKGVLPLLGLFANDHMDYDIDRQPSKEPSLSEMVTKALRILSKDTENQKQGFFLMIEGSRIDMAAHSNDPSAHVRDIVAYQDAVAVVKSFVNENPDTIMISVSDHETGGFTLGRQTNISDYPDYLWYPEVIARPRNSTFALQQAVLAYNASDKETFVREEIVKKGLGIDNVTNKEIADILAGGRPGDIFRLDAYLANMTSFRAQLGWTTHGHTGVDVNLYAYGQDYEKLRGNHENTDIGDFIVDFLGLNLRSVTKILNKNVTFTTVGADKIINSTDGLQHFHSHP